MVSTPTTPRHPLHQSITASSINGKKIPLDITTLPSYDLLTDSERHLCSNLRIVPKAYISIKDVILKEFATKGCVKRRALRNLIKIDGPKCMRIAEFFVEMGWISTPK